jgi:transglutaminase-like putative cysteine protease
MNVQIHFQTKYIYEEPVSLSVHLYRLFPRTGRSVIVQESTFRSNADAKISYQRDLFDNEVGASFHPALTTTLDTSLHLTLSITERDPFDFLLAPHALSLPFQYTPDEQHVLRPFLSSNVPPTLPFWQPPMPSGPTIETLLSLNRSMNQHIVYERREEGNARTPEETLLVGGGACRDVSVLMAASLQGLGLAARLASGYLIEAEGEEKKAEGALHAWVETYLPGAGWLGLDPTNGTLCDHRHIATAVGLTTEHIAPTLGRYFHDRVVNSDMTSTLTVETVE